jgi:hypothetical protein
MDLQKSIANKHCNGKRLDAFILRSEIIYKYLLLPILFNILKEVTTKAIR